MNQLDLLFDQILYNISIEQFFEISNEFKTKFETCKY